MSVSFPFTRGRMIVTPVEMRHSLSAWPAMALDTGARTTVITPEFAAALGFEPEGLELTVNVVGATGTAFAARLTVRSVSVMGLEVPELQVICHRLPARLGLQGILGLNFLKHFKIVIDNETETVTLTKWRE